MIDYAEVARQARDFLTWEMPSSPDIYLCWCGARSFGLFMSVGQSPYSSEDRAVVKEASKAGRYWCRAHLAEHRPDVLLALLVLGGGGL